MQMEIKENGKYFLNVTFRSRNGTVKIINIECDERKFDLLMFAKHFVEGKGKQKS